MPWLCHRILFHHQDKKISDLNLYPSINERTILLLSYILSPSLTQSEREGLLLKYEARGIMDAYIRRGKLGFNIGNNESLISTDYSACRCNCSKCSAFANEICNKAKPLNSEVLNHMSIYTECFPKNKVFTPFRSWIKEITKHLIFAAYKILYCFP